MLFRISVLLIFPLLALAEEQTNAKERGEEVCPVELITSEKPVKSEASANIISNVFNRPGSLKHEIRSLVEKGLEDIAEVNNICDEKNCPEAPPRIVLVTKPKGYLDKYDERSACQTLFERTSREALQYITKGFSSTDKLVDWFNDFSQGKGKKGEDLYRRCPGSCSPQFTSIIEQQGRGLNLSVDVVCGHARDKNENLYNLEYRLVQDCTDNP